MIKDWFITFLDTKDGDIILKANKLYLPGLPCEVSLIKVNPEKKADSKNIIDAIKIGIPDVVDKYTFNYNDELNCSIELKAEK